MREMNKSKKANISLRRRVAICYQRFMLLLKLSLLIFVCLFVFTDMFKVFKDRVCATFYKISANYGFVLQNVIIDGQKNTPSKDIIDMLGADKGTPIFAINMEEVKDKLEGSAWVKGAIIERRLPSTIYIAVIERLPIAIWQFKHKLYLVDAEGNRISKYEGKGFGELIQVVGQDANIYAQNLIDDLNRYPGLGSKIKSAVRYGQRRWNINLEQNITVKMPEEKFGEAYDYLQLLDKNKKLFDQNYKMLDLRDSNKYYLEKY